MSEPENVTELHLLRAVRRRNLWKGLTVLIPIMALWWLLFHWVEHHFKVKGDLAQIGSLLVIIAGVSALSRRFWWAGRDWRETPRIRWLQKEAYERSRSSLRKFWIIAISLLLLSGFAELFRSQTQPAPVMNWGLIVMMMMVTQTILWKLPTSMDELAQAQYLTATRLAYLVTVVLCVSGLLLNIYWPDRLPALVTLSLLAGMLAHQLSLAILEARGNPRDD